MSWLAAWSAAGALGALAGAVHARTWGPLGVLVPPSVSDRRRLIRRYAPLEEHLARRLRLTVSEVRWAILSAGSVGAVGLAVLGVPAAVVLALAAATVPVVRGRRRAKRRHVALEAEVPLLLDLLAAASSAGLGAPLALARSAPALVGPLEEEVRASLDRVELGARWRNELESLAERSGSSDLRRTVVALTRSETLGSSLATSMTDLADDVRRARAARLAEQARKAPVKMLFPLVFLVLPAFLLLTVVPVLLSTIRSIG